MSAWSDAVVATTPYLYWRLGEASGSTAADSSGNGRSGTYASVTYSQTSLVPSDTADAAIAIDNANDQVSSSSVSYSSIDFSAMVVVKGTSNTGGGIFASSTTNRLDLGATNVAVLIDSTSVALTPSYPVANLYDGTAHLVVLVVKATSAELWVDGAMVASGTHSKPGTTRTTFQLKRGSSNPSAGTWDELTLWNRGLSSTEINTVYSAFAGAAAGTVTLSGTVQAATAAFTVATVLAASLAGTTQAPTAEFDLSASAQVSLAGVVQASTGSFSLDAQAEQINVALAGTTQAPTGAFEAFTVGSVSLAGETQPTAAEFSLSAAAQVALAGTAQSPTAEFIVSTADRTVALAGSAQRATAVVSLVGAPSVRLAGTVRPATGALTVVTLPTVVLAGTVQQSIASFTTYVVTPVTPAPPSVAAATSVVVARAHGEATMQGTQPVYSVSQAEIARGRQQIVVDGEDWTYFRGVRTPDVPYTLLEPLLYGPGTLDLPQIALYLGDEPGVGDLAKLRPQAPVEVNLVVDDVVVAPLWRGFIAAFDTNAGELSVELGGEANGRAAMRDRQVPIFPRINDIGHQMADAVRDLGLAHQPPRGAVTGIETMTTGGTGHLDHINNLVAMSWTRSGKQWTVMPDPLSGAYETHRKDATTVHATAFLDKTRTVARLRRDIAEEPNQIFVTCVTPAGMRVRFGKYPGFVQGPVPDFPGSMFLGSSGEGVRLLIGKLHASGYLKLADVAGGYDYDVMRAVISLQNDAGLYESGEVNSQTWDALYDLDVTGLSLEWANVQPAAQRSKTREFNRSANGTIMGFNDDYDPEVIVRHRSIDLGTGVTRSQAREFARTVLHDSDSANWVGDITFNTGALLRGEHAIGATVTPADVMDARELRPGMNVWLPQFDGGTLVHVAACQVDGDGTVTATVDTRFRDAMEVWQVLARNAESRNDPSRHRQRRYRASTIQKDSIGEWDEFGGFLGVDIPLKRGWNRFPVIAAMEGQIRDFEIALETEAEFAVAVWGDKPDLNWLDDLNPHPLTITGTKVWETRGDELVKDHFLLFSAGTHEEPCGYWPGRKKWKSVTGEEANPAYSPDADDNNTGTDDAETITVTTSESSGTLTGKHVDAAGFPYFAVDRKVIWVTVWVRGDNKIPLGRVMKPQMEAGA